MIARHLLAGMLAIKLAPQGPLCISSRRRQKNRWLPPWASAMQRTILVEPWRPSAVTTYFCMVHRPPRWPGLYKICLKLAISIYFEMSKVGFFAWTSERILKYSARSSATKLREHYGWHSRPSIIMWPVSRRFGREWPCFECPLSSL